MSRAACARRSNRAPDLAVDEPMPDLTIPLICAAAFAGMGWLIVNAGPHYAAAIRHTLSIFALVLGMLVLAGVTAKLHALLGVGRMSHRVEARSQLDPARPVRPSRGDAAGGRP